MGFFSPNIKLFYADWFEAKVQFSQSSRVLNPKDAVRYEAFFQALANNGYRTQTQTTGLIPFLNRTSIVELKQSLGTYQKNNLHADLLHLSGKRKAPINYQKQVVAFTKLMLNSASAFKATFVIIDETQTTLTYAAYAHVERASLGVDSQNQLIAWDQILK